MMPEMLTSGRLLLCGIDVYMIYRFLKSMFALRGNGKMRLLFYTLAASAIFLINAYGITLLNLITVPVIFLMISVSAFELSFAQGIAYTIIYYAIFGAGREIAHECLSRILSSFFSIPAWFTEYGIYYLIPEYIISFLLLLLIERFTKKLDVRKSKEFAWYLLIMPVSTVIVLSGFLYMDNPISVLSRQLMCIGAFTLYLSNIAIFIILAKYTEILDRKKYEEMSIMKQNMDDEKYKNIVKLNEHYRNYMHDMHMYLNHFQMLALNGQPQKIVELISELEGKIKLENSDIMYSNNETLNTLLSERSIKARNEKVELTIFVEKFLKLDFISDTDMISMFGNLLDNALEATIMCDLEDRKVDVKIFMGNQYMLVLYIENSMVLSAERDGEKLLTTKKDKQYHGLGISIVEKLADKYGGTLCLEEDGKLFKTTLLISAYKK